MIQIRCTQKLRHAWDLKAKDLAEVKENRTLLGNWYAHLFNLDGLPTVIFVNEKTLISFLILGVKKDDARNWAKAFVVGSTQLLLLLGLTEDKVARIINDYKDVQFTKTDSNRLLRKMNALIKYYQTNVRMRGGLKYTDFDELIFLANTIPQPQHNYLSAIDYLHNFLGELL